MKLSPDVNVTVSIEWLNLDEVVGKVELHILHISHRLYSAANYVHNLATPLRMHDINTGGRISKKRHSKMIHEKTCKILGVRL
jgi:hypothetical protein